MIRKNLLVFEVLFRRDAGSHDGGEFGIVHHVAAGVLGEVLFHNLFRSPANAGGNAGKSCCINDCLHKLVVRRHGIYLEDFFKCHSRQAKHKHLSLISSKSSSM